MLAADVDAFLTPRTKAHKPQPKPNHCALSECAAVAASGILGAHSGARSAPTSRDQPLELDVAGAAFQRIQCERVACAHLVLRIAVVIHQSNVVLIDRSVGTVVLIDGILVRGSVAAGLRRIMEMQSAGNEGGAAARFLDWGIPILAEPWSSEMMHRYYLTSRNNGEYNR